jgi:tetratricopeptide (TPR) repeat protein
MSILLRSACLLLFSLFLFLTAAGAQKAQKDALSPEALREIAHNNPQWLAMQPHLPDPATATADRLEMAGDVLRARRFPEDALDYYLYALRRGGQEAMLIKKIGITELELRNITAARVYFQQAIRINKKDAQGWNDLGAVEYLDGHYGRAISNYGRAIKLEKGSAIYHSNLGTAFFEQKNYKKARQEYAIALELDPKMSEHDGATGISARMLSPADRARYCFEMARLYAEHGDEASLIHYLTMASEGGFDVLKEMETDKILTGYRKDPRVLLLVRNAQALRGGRNAIADTKGELPPMPPAGR